MLSQVACSIVVFAIIVDVFVVVVVIFFLSFFGFSFTPYFLFFSLSASDLEKFDQLCVSLSTWCQEHAGEGMKTLPKVKEVVAVRQQRKKKGEGGEEEEVEETWARAMVSRQVSDM